MDGALGEVIIGNKIYSARYAQPPRAVLEEAEDGAAGSKEKNLVVAETVTHGRWIGVHTDADDATGAVCRVAADQNSWLHRRSNGALVTTDLDELPAVETEEPDYINLRVGDPAARQDDDVMAPHFSKIPSSAAAGRKIFTNTYGREENIYEEINELQRRLALEQTVSMVTGQQQHQHWQGFHRQTTPSLVDEVMDEVARVRLGHDTVLNQLNLDLEHFLKPQTPEPSPTPPTPPLVPPPLESQRQHSLPHLLHSRTDQPVKDRSRSIGDRPCDQVTPPPVFSTPPTGRLARRFISHNRSNSSVSFTMSQLIGAGERSLVRCESLDFVARDVSVQRRPSVISRGSTSTSSSVSSSNRSDTRQSIRNLHQGLQHGIQGLADWTEKCGHMLAKRSKKVIAFVNKGKESIIFIQSEYWMWSLLGPSPSE